MKRKRKWKSLPQALGEFFQHRREALMPFAELAKRQAEAAKPQDGCD